MSQDRNSLRKPRRCDTDDIYCFQDKSIDLIMNIGYELSKSVIFLNLVESFSNDIAMDLLYPMIQCG